jgi:hypothetical protein
MVVCVHGTRFSPSFQARIHSMYQAATNDAFLFNENSAQGFKTLYFYLIK